MEIFYLAIYPINNTLKPIILDLQDRLNDPVLKDRLAEDLSFICDVAADFNFEDYFSKDFGAYYAFGELKQRYLVLAVCVDFISKDKEKLFFTQLGMDPFNVNYLKSLIHSFSKPQTAIEKTKAEIEDAKRVATEVIDKLCDRSASLEDLIKQTDQLRDRAELYKKTCKKLNKQATCPFMFWAKPFIFTYEKLKETTTSLIHSTPLTSKQKP